MICGYLNCSAICLGLKGKTSVIKLIDTSGEESQTNVQALRLSFSDSRNRVHSVLVTAQYLHQSCDRTYVGHLIMEPEKKDPALSGLYFIKRYSFSM